MALQRLCTLSLIVVAAAGARSAATPPGPTADAADVASLSAKIDALLANSWNKGKVEPASPAEDSEFLRRVYLDLGGRIPSVSRARAFLDDTQPEKRRRLVEELLSGPHYVNHFTTVWRNLLVPEASTGQFARFLESPMEAWLRERLQENAPYDAMVRELITVPYGASMQPFAPNAKPSPIAFYFAKEIKPENLAASTGRLFLGIKLECAQCHNHPFAAWKREQFWSYAAFFSGLDRRDQGNFVQPLRDVPERRELTIPGTDRVVRAAFPDGTQPAWKPKEASRAALAAWMTRPDNPYFARAAANRIWAHFFGTGLADPVDEIAGGQNAPRQPELLDELARQLSAHHFDLKFLMRAITASKAYQLSSTATHKSQDDPHQFARMAVRGLTPEQLFDTLAEATAFREEGVGQPGTFRIEGNVRRQFLAKFANQAEKPTEIQTSILQALTLMNGRLVSDATSLDRSELLAAVLDAPFFDTAARVETLYLSTLSRLPRPREASRAQQFIDAALTPEDGAAPLTEAEREKRYKHALGDVLWALLNSGEFFLNH
jgi:hypothetical protein